MRAARSAWIVAGTASSAASGSSASMASICSTNSGLPSAAATMRSRSAGRDVAVVHQPVDQILGLVVTQAARARRALVRGRGAAQDGRASKRSGRARQRSRIGAPLEKPRTYSSRSSSVGSAQWMSSTTTTSGFESASVSNSRRNAHAVSSGEPGSSFAPIAPMISRVAIGAALDVRQELRRGPARDRLRRPRARSRRAAGR